MTADVRVKSNGPSLEASITGFISLKYFKRNALLAKGLGQGETAQAGANYENMHLDRYVWRKEGLQRNVEGPLVDSRYKYPICADASVLIKEVCYGVRKSPD